MKILINASNLSGGGGAQVCDSICRYLKDYPQHSFVVVLSPALDNTASAIKDYSNVEVVRYGVKGGDIKALLTFRNSFLDQLVTDHSIDCVFTVFGPIKWRPRVPHISGFGLSHIVMPESPYFQRMSVKERLKWKVTIATWKYIFRRSADTFITENPLITERLHRLFPEKKVVTITNNYNQVFDQPENQKERKLPPFDGVQLLDVAAFGPHKNEVIALDIAEIFRKKYPTTKIRFIFTFDRKLYPTIPDSLKEYFYFTGNVSIQECPSLYEQCDMEFQPTLLECFTATYPEGMRMKKPIITTDLEFAHGLCGNAALYYDSLSAESAADVIYNLITSKEIQQKLVTEGISQLRKFDNSKERACKIVSLCEDTCYRIR